MAFFKFRMPGQASAAQAAAAENAASESAEVLRQRARHRLLGAAVLVVLAVIGFPFLFDTQPRTVSVDIAVDIPDKNKARSPASPAQALAAAKESADPTDRIVVFGSFLTVGGLIENGLPILKAPHFKN